MTTDRKQQNEGATLVVAIPTAQRTLVQGDKKAIRSDSRDALSDGPRVGEFSLRTKGGLRVISIAKNLSAHLVTPLQLCFLAHHSRDTTK